MNNVLFWSGNLTLRLLYCMLIFGSSSLCADQYIQPIPMVVPHDAAKASLGKKLFNDVRLSKDNTISCASCHILSNAGVDSVRVSEGIAGQIGSRNSPTVYNSVFNFKQFWDGRAESLADQARGPVTNPVEMGMDSWDATTKKLNNIEEYRNAFKKLYDNGITEDNVVDAIAEFEKTLITTNSPFDRFLKGNKSAISEEAQRGYRLFKAYGCVSCHQGVNVGGNMFQKFGALKDANLRNPLDNDLGRYEVTKNEWDKRVFKVPSLRLAVFTSPYFHDGSVETLDEAVNIMIEYQLGRAVPVADRTAIIEFLKTLPGDLPKGDK